MESLQSEFMLVISLGSFMVLFANVSMMEVRRSAMGTAAKHTGRSVIMVQKGLWVWSKGSGSCLSLFWHLDPVLLDESVS